MVFAVVGTDGTRAVVWGLGDTADAARTDARRWLADANAVHEADSLDVEEITAEQAAIVRAGDVSWPIVVR